MTGLNRKLLLIAQNHKNELMLSIREKTAVFILCYRINVAVLLLVAVDMQTSP